MSAQEQTLTELAALLDRLRIPYMVIGGLANAVWGEPRATLDIDATVWVRDADVAAAVAELGAAFRVLVPSPAEFIGRTRVLPLESQAGVRIDIIFGLLPFEEEAIRRSVVVAVAGMLVRFCTAEDLILHKIVSERPQDQADVRGSCGDRWGAWIWPTSSLGSLSSRGSWTAPISIATGAPGNARRQRRAAARGPDEQPTARFMRATPAPASPARVR